MNDQIINDMLSNKTEPFIIAEMSGNHNQSLERALEIVDMAASCGAHAIKLQTYTADTMTIESTQKGFVIEDPNNMWNGESLYDLYKKASTPWEWHKKIFDRAKENGIYAFSSPFDDTAVDFLETLNIPFYKIASFENTDISLIKKVARTGKPMIISTGMASISELDESVRVARSHGCKNIVLLKCTSTYPADPTNTNLLTIPHMEKLFDCSVGLSDHTMGIGASVAAVALGAPVIEKHFTINREDGGVDAAFSLEPNELKSLVIETKRAWQALGCVKYGPTDAESGAVMRRRSLYVVADLKSGDLLTKDNVRSIRPGYGLPTKYMDDIIGMRVTKDVPRGTPLDWDMLKNT